MAGSDPGPAKVKKAKDLGIKTLDEDGFYELVNSFGPTGTDSERSIIETKKVIEDKVPPKQPPVVVSQVLSKSSNPTISKGKASADSPSFSSNISKQPTSSLLWTDKYKPKSYDEVIGNGSLVAKLAEWLKNWESNKQQGFPKSGKGDSSSFRAALLSGPPGIGKTTAAHLVAKFEGFEAIEFNASDTRSKKALEVRFIYLIINVNFTLVNCKRGDFDKICDRVVYWKKSKIVNQFV